MTAVIIEEGVLNFKGIDYSYKDVEVKGSENYPDTVYRLSTTKLGDVLSPYIFDNLEDEFTKEAQDLYDDIWYFADEDEYNLTGDDLVKFLEDC